MSDRTAAAGSPVPSSQESELLRDVVIHIDHCANGLMSTAIVGAVRSLAALVCRENQGERTGNWLLSILPAPKKPERIATVDPIPTSGVMD